MSATDLIAAVKKAILPRVNTKSEAGVDKVLELVRNNKLSNEDAKIILSGLKDVTINIANIDVKQSGYNNSLLGHAGHIEGRR